MEKKENKCVQISPTKNNIQEKKATFLQTQIADKANYDAFKRLTEK